ncbi:hypothetical protein Cs7R123_32620 [Catellatospora sp. TT07R-123]|uniref:hypothetical protein n=1 Tax=Catellatospora sp. TT07R-123 TaxID=2733863 RepID=UPI001B135120|nr:hypothetical protein [Catellatospora sp. TT07R-123]GHJ45920.1 hypothetical protein Cs7R123_32620 [Catellatospora sp. TT07R-123]
MSNSFLETGRTRRTGPILIIIAALAVIAIAVTTIVIVVANTSPDPKPEPSVQPTLSVPTGPLTLIKGSYTVDGVSVGYPHTVAGAVSAAAEYATQIGSTLDPDRARMIAGAIADPSFENARDYFAQGPVNSRQRLSLPLAGPIPANASLTLGPAAYQLRSPSEDAVVVLILGYLSMVGSDGKLISKIGVFPMEMHWANSDWKALKPGTTKATDFSSLATTPGSSEAAAKGWLELRP